MADPTTPAFRVLGPTPVRTSRILRGTLVFTTGPGVHHTSDHRGTITFSEIRRGKPAGLSFYAGPDGTSIWRNHGGAPPRFDRVRENQGVPLPIPILRNTGAQPRPGDFTESPHFRDGFFHNRHPGTEIASQGGRVSIARDFARKGNSGKPSGVIPLGTPVLPAIADDCAATWLGHATVLLEVGGHWVLADPVWSERVSPASRVGPRRHHPVPLALRNLPQLSAVLISHDHYDHLDTRTIEWLNTNQQVPFVVPLGVGAHLRRWGVAEHRIVELDWDQTHTIDGLRLTCVEAQHFSGRLFTNNTTLWSSWVINAGGAPEENTVLFGGDTGYHPGFSDIGAKHGPFNLTVLPIGAYDNRWRDVHMNPAEAIRAHREMGGAVLLPIHWATFDLAFHSWSAPIEWLLRDAGEIDVATPRPGQRFTVGDSATLPTEDWWSSVGHP